MKLLLCSLLFLMISDCNARLSSPIYFCLLSLSCQFVCRRGFGLCWGLSLLDEGLCGQLSKFTYLQFRTRQNPSFSLRVTVSWQEVEARSENFRHEFSQQMVSRHGWSKIYPEIWRNPGGRQERILWIDLSLSLIKYLLRKVGVGCGLNSEQNPLLSELHEETSMLPFAIFLMTDDKVTANTTSHMTPPQVTL